MFSAQELQVWRIQLDVTVLDAAGNVTDAAFLCAMTALMAFKRPEVIASRVNQCSVVRFYKVLFFDPLLPTSTFRLTQISKLPTCAPFEPLRD